MKGYKVALHDDEKLRSAAVYFGRVQYSIGTKTFPRQFLGPICVFGNMEDAERFVEVYGELSKNWEIWECEYEPSEKTTVWNCYMDAIPLGELSHGTRLADWVELKNIVGPSQIVRINNDTRRNVGANSSL